MLLLVGLGNPGQKYEHNRHNIGYVAVDEIVHRHSFGPWKSRFQGVVSEGRLGSQKVLALKPATFMNLSGQSVGEAMRFFKLGLEDVVVLHDELVAAVLATTASKALPSILGPSIAAFASVSATPATGTRSQAMSCMTLPRPTGAGSTTLCRRSPMLHQNWLMATTQAL